MHYTARITYPLGVAALVCSLLIMFLDHEGWDVILYLTLTLWAGAFFFFALNRKSGGPLDLLEIGGLYMVILLMYACVPLIGFLSNGMAYHPSNDDRLFQARPGGEDIAEVARYYLIYLLSFGCCYLLVRGKGKKPQFSLIKQSNRTLVRMIALYLVVRSCPEILKLAFDVPVSESYAASYTSYRGLPLIVQQIANHARGIGIVLSLILVTVLASDFARRKRLLAAWICLEILLALWNMGSRTALFVVLLSLALAYHYLVETLRFRALLVGGIVGLAAFLMLGLFRDGVEGDHEGIGWNFFERSSEFEILFGNAFELARLKANGALDDIMPTLYYADFLKLIPQQLLSVPKLDLAALYVRTFHADYEASGGGLAFGAISESLSGLGVFDLLWRGAFVGLMLGFIQRIFMKTRVNIQGVVFYLWVTVMSYQMFRDTTFSLVPRFLFQFVPAVVLSQVFARLVTQPRHSS
jgi:hypothetical protein